MSSTNTTASSSPTAAARVFAIPELLEEILIRLANRAITRSCFGLCLEPIATLSRCQAVNHDFHATIAGSKKLQRLMEFAQCEIVGCVGDDAENTLHGLFNDQLGLFFYPGDRHGGLFGDSPPDCERRFEVHLDFPYGCDILERKAQIEEFQRTNGVEEASWRQLRLSRQEGSIVVEFVFRWDQEGTQEVEFEEGDTLGRVFDAYCSQVEDAVSRYNDARR